MKSLLQLIAVIAIAAGLSSCAAVRPSTPTTSNMEAVPMGVGAQGTVLMKVYSYGKTVEEAKERAKMDAVYLVMFKGLPGSNVAKPLINDPSIEQAQKKYFFDFFGLDTWFDWSNAIQNLKLRHDNASAPYRAFVQFSNDGSIDPADRLRVGSQYKVGVVVSVMHSQLRKKLERDGIIRGFGL